MSVWMVFLYVDTSRLFGGMQAVARRPAWGHGDLQLCEDASSGLCHGSDLLEGSGGAVKVHRWE